MEMIKDFMDGHTISAQLLITTVDKCVTTQGRNYLNINLQDSSGTIFGKKWEIEGDDLETFVPGNIVLIKGEVLDYRGSLQVKIIDGQKIPVAEVDVTKFVPKAPVPKEELERQFKEYIDSLPESDLKKIVVYLTDKYYDRYVIHPAAVRNHHNFASGLLYHSVCMANTAEAICKLYPHLNRDWLIAATLIHDLGKVMELSGPIATKYTVEGNLVGHISIMSGEIRMAAKELGIEGETPVLLQHMLLSHHNKPEYGSPVPPLTREALALSMIDDFDAKMNIIDKAVENASIGGFTEKIFALDCRAYYVPTYEEKNRK